MHYCEALRLSKSNNSCLWSLNNSPCLIQFPLLSSGFCVHSSVAFLLVSYSAGSLGTHTEIKRVAEEKVTLPCHHQLGFPEKDTLDIEWLLTDNEGNQKVVSVAPARSCSSLNHLFLHSQLPLWVRKCKMLLLLG